MSVPVDKPKKYSLDYSLREDSARISRHLKKGYLKRRDVTELVDQIHEGTPVKASWGENGKIQWTVGDTPITPSIATNKTPFWLRRIAYFFSWNSKQELKEKVEVIKKAYDDLIAKTAVERQAEAARLAEELKTAGMEAAKEETNTLKNELTVLQEDVKQTESLLQAAEVNRDIAGGRITSLSFTRIALREALINLNELDQTIQNNFFGTWTLTDEEKFKLGNLENTIFGEINDRLKEKEFRISGKEILNQKIQAISDEIDATGEQLSPLSDAIIELQAAIPSKKEILKQSQEALEALIVDYRSQGLLPLEEIEVPIIEIEIQPMTISEPVERPLDFSKVLIAQHVDSSPLFNRKILFTSICNEDDFYKNSFCPALKIICLILTSNPTEAQDLYVKWEQQIRELAALWRDSGSMDQDIDALSLSGPFSLIEKLDRLNKLIGAVNYKGLKLQDFIQNLSTVEIPKKINLDLQIPLSEATLLLEKYRTEPTDLSPLFSDPTYKNWPKEIQYLTAALTLKFYSNLALLETDPEYRKQSLGILTHSVNFSPPKIATSFASLAVGTAWIFNNSIGPMAKLAISIMKPGSEIDELNKMLNFYIPDKEKFQKAVDFAKTPDRKKFDKAKLAFMSSFAETAVDAALAKHTSEDKDLGKEGKEYNIQKLVVSSLNNSQTMKASVRAMKEYLEELEKPEQNPEELKKKRAKVEETKGDSIGCSLELYKSFSEIVARSENVQTLLHAIDEKVLPEVLENPLDLEETPMHEWLQHRVLSHLQHFGS